MYAVSKTTFNVTFRCTYAPVIISITDQIWLYGVIDIDGGGLVTLDGDGIYRQFVIGKQAPRNLSFGLQEFRQPKVTLRNLVIANGGGSPTIVVSSPGLAGSNSSLNKIVGKRDGGCLHAMSGAAVYLYNVVFSNCKTISSYVPDLLVNDHDVTFDGGAIFMDNNVQLTAKNTSFINNVAGMNN